LVPIDQVPWRRAKIARRPTALARRATKLGGIRGRRWLRDWSGDPRQALENQGGN